MKTMKRFILEVGLQGDFRICYENGDFLLAGSTSLEPGSYGIELTRRGDDFVFCSVRRFYQVDSHGFTFKVKRSAHPAFAILGF